MLPAVLMGVGVAVGVAGGIKNYLDSEDAQRATDEEIDRLQRLVEAIQSPNFDIRKLTPEDYKIGAKYVPELASYIEEKAPTLVKAAGPDAVRGRQAQLESLDRFRSLAITGEDTQSQILREKAMDASARQNAAQQGAIRERMAQQGRGGSEMDYVQSLLAQQGSAQNASKSGQDAALAAYNTRLQAQRDAANLGGNIRQEDVDVESKNANTINAFNTRMANSYQDYVNRNVQIRNQAQAANLARANAVSDKNVGQRNEAEQDYQNMINTIRQRQYDNDMRKMEAQSGVVRSKIGNIQNSTANKAKAVGDISGSISRGAMAGSAYANNLPTEDAVTAAGAPAQSSLNLGAPEQNQSMEDPDALWRKKYPNSY